MDELFALSTSLLLIADESAGQWRPETNQSEAVDFVGFVDGQRHRRREDYVAGD